MEVFKKLSVGQHTSPFEIRLGIYSKIHVCTDGAIGSSSSEDHLSKVEQQDLNRRVLGGVLSG